MAKDPGKGEEKESRKDAPKKMSVFATFALGATAGSLSSIIVQPMDLVKTRMQVSDGAGGVKPFKNSIDCFKAVVTAEGPLALYQGLSAGVLRQITYTGGRLGGYMVLNDLYKSTYNTSPGIAVNLLMGVAAGILGAILGNPADVALIRMTADGRMPPEKKRNYKSVFNALYRMAKEEGVLTLWRGCLPTTARSIVVNMTQLTTYSRFKNYFHSGPPQMKDGIKLHVVASMLSAIFTTTLSMPMDMAKTRLQEMRIINNKPEFSGTLDVLIKTCRSDGFFALWRGFPPYFFRLGPHTVFTFIFLEQLTLLYNKYILGIEGKGSTL